MKNEKKISDLYNGTFDNINASSELMESVKSVPTMKRSRRPSAKIYKVAFALAAALVLTVAGTAIASANKGYKYQGVYDTVVLNGVEVSAKFADFGNNVRSWDIEQDGLGYGVFIYGPYDTENDTLYLKDFGDYFIASTEAEPTLNFYDEIDNTPYADLVERGSMMCLGIKNDLNRPTPDSPLVGEYYSMTFFDFVQADEKDGTRDGVLYEGKPEDDAANEAYTILPSGAVVQTIKEKVHHDDYEDNAATDFWNAIWHRMGSPEIVTDGE